MKKKGWTLLVLVVLLVSISSFAIVDQSLDNGEIEVIIMLEDEPVTDVVISDVDSFDKKDKKLNLRKEVVKKSQREFIEKHVERKSEKKSKKGEKSKKSLDSDQREISIGKTFTYINGLTATINKEDIDEIKKDPKVKGVFIPMKYHILPDDSLIINDGPISISTSTSVPSIGASEVKSRYGLTGENITVAIVDTGIDYTHDDFGDCTSIGGSCRIIGGYDYVNNDADPKDDNGHGTHVAGIAGANGSIVGVAPDIKFLAYKVCNAAGSCPVEADIIAAIDAAIGNETNVVSLSLGGEKTPNDGTSALSVALNDAISQGVVAVVSAGNNGPSTGCISSPADGVDVITVGNSNDQGNSDISDDTIVSSSCSGPSAFGRLDPDLVAPGANILSTYLSDTTATLTGTSMSAPHVSGIAALLLQYNSSLTPEVIRGMLMHTASDIGEHVFEQGAGIINITKSIEYNLTINVSGYDRWEASVSKGAISSKNFTITNTNGFAVNLSVDATNLSDLEGDFSQSNSSYDFTDVIVEANSVATVEFNYTTPIDSNASIYGSTIEFRSNHSHNLRVPVVFSVKQGGEGTILGTVDKDRTACSNSPCGDKIMYYFSSINGNKTINLTWSSTSNDLDLYAYNSSGTQLAVSGAASTEIESITLNSTFTDFWIMLHSFGLATDDTDFSYNLTLTSSQVPATITFKIPTNKSYHNSLFNLNVTISDSNGIANSNYSITNASSLVQNNSSSSISGNSFTWTDIVNITNSTYNDDNYTLLIFINDSEGNSTEDSVVFVVDTTNPLLFASNISLATIYNNDTVVFTFNTTDTYLNSSGIFIESNYSGSYVNYSMALETGAKYNYTLSGRSNLTNQNNISYQFHASDLAGNINSSEIFSLFVENRNPYNLAIDNPSNNALLEIGNNSEFNSSALDDDLDTLIYTWNFSDSTDLVVSQNTTHQFNSTGDFVIIINVSDTYANNQTNITITVNDTLPPLTDSITYLTEHHLSRDGANYSINTTLFDYSGVFSSTLEYNNTTQTSSCNDENVSWNCSWTIENLTVATYSFTLNATDNFTTQHRNSTDYSFNVVSCSDETENGDETGVDCGGSCDACAGTSGSSSSSSSSSGGGGSGGGSGGGTTAAVVTPDSPTKNPVSSEKAVESSGAAAAVVVNSASEAPTIFNQDISFSKDKYTQIKFEDETLSVKELEIKSGVDKVTVLKVDYFEEKPSEVFSLLGAYQYFEITVDLSADEIDHATLKFEVPKSWFEEHSYLPESVKLNTFEDEKWIELKTDFVDESEYFFSYQAELKHFSFFAINARKSSGNLFGGVVAFFKNIPELLSVRVLVLFSFIVLILVLAVIYFKIREKDY